MRRIFRAALVAFALALVCVHFLEEPLLPVAQGLRAMVLGEPIFARAQKGCSGLTAGGGWVHPAALSLTVYDDAQRELVARYGEHANEVLPDYADKRSAQGDLRCVADYLLAAAPVSHVGGYPVRAMRYATAKDQYGLEPGWVSGLAQGLAGQVFIASWLRYGDKRYFEAAQQVGNLLRVEVDGGGVRVSLPGGDSWFEEYAQAGREPPLVLNGHLLALDFLYWMRQADAGGPWGDMFDAGARAAAERIGTYSGRLWSYYDALALLANHKYHKFHVRQLLRYEQHDPSGRLHAARTRMQWQLWVPLGVMQRFFTQPSRLLAFLVTAFSLFFFALILLAGWVRTRRSLS